MNRHSLGVSINTYLPKIIDPAPYIRNKDIGIQAYLYAVMYRNIELSELQMLYGDVFLAGEDLSNLVTSYLEGRGFHIDIFKVYVNSPALKKEKFSKGVKLIPIEGLPKDLSKTTDIVKFLAEREEINKDRLAFCPKEKFLVTTREFKDYTKSKSLEVTLSHNPVKTLDKIEKIKGLDVRKEALGLTYLSHISDKTFLLPVKHSSPVSVSKNYYAKNGTLTEEIKRKFRYYDNEFELDLQSLQQFTNQMHISAVVMFFGKILGQTNKKIKEAIFYLLEYQPKFVRHFLSLGLEKTLYAFKDDFDLDDPEEEEKFFDFVDHDFILDYFKRHNLTMKEAVSDFRIFTPFLDIESHREKIFDLFEVACRVNPEKRVSRQMLKDIYEEQKKAPNDEIISKEFDLTLFENADRIKELSRKSELMKLRKFGYIPTAAYKLIRHKLSFFLLLDSKIVIEIGKEESIDGMMSTYTIKKTIKENGIILEPSEQNLIDELFDFIRLSTAQEEILEEEDEEGPLII